MIGPEALAALLLVLLAGCAGEPQQSVDVEGTPDQVTFIHDVLREQEAAWNRGDLEAFMRGYWQSDSLRFASGGNVRYGWQATLDGYRRGYPDRSAMGMLSFDSLTVNLLSRDDAYVFGRWSLARDSSFVPASGLFTLIFHRFPEGWRIVHDHTSSAR